MQLHCFRARVHCFGCLFIVFSANPESGYERYVAPQFEKPTEKTRASCFIRGSKHLETIKALRLPRRAFICFSVFKTPDEKLALVFDLLLIYEVLFK